jgi:hypothetical protein
MSWCWMCARKRTSSASKATSWGAAHPAGEPARAARSRIGVVMPPTRRRGPSSE